MKTDIHAFITLLSSRVQEAPERFVFAAFSAPVDSSDIKRVRIRAILIKSQLAFQISSFTKTQSFTVNVTPGELKSEFAKSLDRFSQALVHFVDDEIHAHIENGKATYKITAHKKVYLQDLSHNRSKNYELPEKEPSDFLIALGIQSKDGKVIRDKFDKFKQINRFLELINDIRPEMNTEPHIVDFGCGKAYLTFALYNMLGNATITGIDARKDVIDKCQALKDTLHAKNLHFKQMRIEAYTQDAPVDLVLALHACDTATDAALAQAIKLKAQVILVAPCCQHEVASQIKKDKMPILLEHGLLKERFSALMTDALRAEILNQCGYMVDLIEFIDPEHTPKNLLIRATRKKNIPEPNWKAYKDLAASFGISITLEKLLKIQ
ncbi:MAG: SAM-dependent methyltransferase [Chlamydiales bacterium]|nr:SAM-dependent methyltransferase [Chlamydiales bacterium]